MSRKRPFDKGRRVSTSAGGGKKTSSGPASDGRQIDPNSAEGKGIVQRALEKMGFADEVELA